MRGAFAPRTFWGLHVVTTGEHSPVSLNSNELTKYFTS